MKRKMKKEVRMFCHHFAATEPSLELGSNLLLFRPTSGSNFPLLHLPLLASHPPLPLLPPHHLLLTLPPLSSLLL